MNNDKITNENIRKRLIEQIKLSGLSQAYIAKSVGVKPSAIT